MLSLLWGLGQPVFWDYKGKNVCSHSARCSEQGGWFVRSSCTPFSEVEVKHPYFSQEKGKRGEKGAQSFLFAPGAAISPALVRDQPRPRAASAPPALAGIR